MVVSRQLDCGSELQGRQGVRRLEVVIAMKFRREQKGFVKVCIYVCFMYIDQIRVILWSVKVI